jgi:type IV pilus assembly protein PilV
MKTRRNNNKGMSLIEVMAAMLILAVGVLGLAPLMVITMDANSFANELTQANTLAQDKIESIRNTSTFSPLPYVLTENNVNNRYTVITRVDGAESDATVPTGVYRIFVNVSWVDHNDLPRTIDYRTYTNKQ